MGQACTTLLIMSKTVGNQKKTDMHPSFLSMNLPWKDTERHYVLVLKRPKTLYYQAHDPLERATCCTTIEATYRTLYFGVGNTFSATSYLIIGRISTCRATSTNSAFRNAAMVLIHAKASGMVSVFGSTGYPSNNPCSSTVAAYTTEAVVKLLPSTTS